MDINVTLHMLLIICPLTFLAGFIDSIAGGGGLISLPSYLFIGLPAHAALGTNKFSSSVGTLVAALRYAKNKRIHYRSALTAAASALPGSFAGAQLALALDEKFLKIFLVAALPAIAIFVLTRPKFGGEDRSSRLSAGRIAVLSLASGFLIGMYDGFFGPGTGTFLVLVFTGILGFDITTASGNTKVVNLASNIAALAAFVSGGTVVFAVGIPAALSGVIGNWLGSGLAVKNGERVIRPVFFIALLLLFGKIVWELIDTYL